MRKQQILFSILITILCTAFWSCEGIAELFHGPKPEGPPVTYTVTFNANGATEGTPPITQTVNTGTVISLPDKGNLTNAENIFAGWNESSSGSGVTHSVGASVTVTRNMVFYAQWLDGSPPQYEVTFNANGATGGATPAKQTVFSGVSITIPGQGTLVYSGRTFGGWNTQSNGGGTNYAAGASYTVTASVTLYANWQSAIQYTVAYYANGASGAAPTAQTVDPGTVITLPGAGSLTYIGRTFEGWNTSANGMGTGYAEGEEYTVNANTAFHAQWSEEPLPLQPPGGLNALAQGTSNIQVSWNGVSGATGYRIYRSSSAGGSYNFLSSASSSLYIDSGLSANTTYYYKVSSVKNGEESALSSGYASATTQSSGGVIEYPPAMPTGLVVSSVSSGSISLSWNSVSTADSYNIYRAYTQTGTPAKINTVTGTSCTDNVPAGASYFYTVTGVNSSGESPRSAMAFAFAESHYTLSNYSNAHTLSINSGGKHYYRLEVTRDTSYTIQWQDGDNKDISSWTSYDPRFTVYAYQNNGTQIFSRNSYSNRDGYTNPQVFTATSTGYVTIVVEYTQGTSQNYQIYYY